MIDLPGMDRRTDINKWNNIQRGCLKTLRFLWKYLPYELWIISHNPKAQTSQEPDVSHLWWYLLLLHLLQSGSLNGMFKPCHIMCSQQLHVGVSTRDAPIYWYQHRRKMKRSKCIKTNKTDSTVSAIITQFKKSLKIQFQVRKHLRRHYRFMSWGTGLTATTQLTCLQMLL